MLNEGLPDVTVDELREFLEADVLGVPIDPEFKERLRGRLWELVCARLERRGLPESDEDV
ncbi:MAG: hypothetical protein OEM49_13790 [Myxococcales bacterium]|nr:hypothetical protein [Myxococcales bacterium]MDH5306049.1 hypothetical protein [Myxococcales bacterium]MDH5566641.1 hypothetical protein [Myxococcales bacterium]